MIDVTLACEDAKSKFVEVVTVADVDVGKRVDDSLVQIWKLKFGHITKFLSSPRFDQDFEGGILNLKFGQYFAAYVWLRLWSWIIVEILMFGLDFEVDAWSRIWW